METKTNTLHNDNPWDPKLVTAVERCPRGNFDLFKEYCLNVNQVKLCLITTLWTQKLRLLLKAGLPGPKKLKRPNLAISSFKKAKS